MTFVFGYGSLLRRDDRQVVCRLHGHARAWNVAMDNRETIPGYKYFLDAAGGRPDVFVTFLNLEPRPEALTSGVAIPVSADELEALDARERNYTRVEVTAAIEADLGGRVYAYLGHDEARARFETGHRGRTAVVARAYLEEVRAALGGLEPLEPPPVPVRDLTRVDVP